MVYFQNDRITITYEDDLQLVRTKWHGFANSEEYRQVLDVYLQLVREKPATRWIGDNTNAKAIRPADQEWTAKEWAPLFSQQGKIEKMAVVVSADIFNKMAVENMFIKSSAIISFDTRIFGNEADAYGWVMEE